MSWTWQATLLLTGAATALIMGLELVAHYTGNPTISQAVWHLLALFPELRLPLALAIIAAGFLLAYHLCWPR